MKKGPCDRGVWDSREEPFHSIRDFLNRRLVPYTNICNITIIAALFYRNVIKPCLIKKFNIQYNTCLYLNICINVYYYVKYNNSNSLIWKSRSSLNILCEVNFESVVCIFGFTRENSSSVIQISKSGRLSYLKAAVQISNCYENLGKQNKAPFSSKKKKFICNNQNHTTSNHDFWPRLYNQW